MSMHPKRIVVLPVKVIGSVIIDDSAAVAQEDLIAADLNDMGQLSRIY